MAKRTVKNKTTTRKKPAGKKPIESYDHKDKKRANNPPVGLVTPDTDFGGLRHYPSSVFFPMVGAKDGHPGVSRATEHRGGAGGV